MQLIPLIRTSFRSPILVFIPDQASNSLQLGNTIETDISLFCNNIFLIKKTFSEIILHIKI